MTRRLTLVLLSVTVVVLIALEVPLAVTFEDRRSSELVTELERDALAIGDLIEDQLEGLQAVGLADIAARYQAERDGRVVITDTSGVALADSDPTEDVGESVGRSFASRPEVATALAGTTGVETRYSETLGETIVVVAAPVRSGERILGVVRISRSRADVDDAVRRYQLALAGIGAVTLLVATGLGVLVGRWATLPLRQLQHAAARLGSGDLSARVSVRAGPPEVRDLAGRFNAMATRIETLVRSSQEFAADASHQLRTPLTAMRLRLDNLAEGSADPAATASVQTELARLEETIDGLLALTRVDQQTSHPVAVDLADLAAGRALTWEPAADERSVTVTVDVPVGTAVLFDPNHLEQVIDNLLANALEAAPAGTAVTLSSAPAPAGVELHVIDEGPGLEPADRARALDRRWHRRPGGTGLGLAIVQRLCEHNQAAVRLDEAPSGGLDAVVVMQPAKAPTRRPHAGARRPAAPVPEGTP